MVLKRQEIDNKVKCIYNSSNILASIYDNSTSDLIIIFAKGRQYKYSGVKKVDYFRFETSDSQGKIFNSNIKGYTSEKLDDINPDLIVQEIDKIKNEELKAQLAEKKEKLVIELNILSDYIGKDGSDRALIELKLETIKNNTDIYLKQLNK